MAVILTETVEHNTVKTKATIVILMEHKPTKGYLDLTGRFPYRSAQGNQYMFVAYHVDSNAILEKAIKITKTWRSINDRLKKQTKSLTFISLIMKLRNK